MLIASIRHGGRALGPGVIAGKRVASIASIALANELD